MTPDGFPLYYVLGSLALAGTVELVYRLAHKPVEGSGPMHEPSYMLVQTALVFLSLLAMGVTGLGFSLTAPMAALGVFNGLLGYITGWSHIYAIGRGPVSVTSALRRLSFVVTGALAIAFLGERLTDAKLLAVLLAVAATLVMAGGSDATQRPHPMILLTVFSAGLMAFVHKLAAVSGVSTSAFLMCQSGTAHVIAHLACRRSGGYQLTRRMGGFGLLTGATIATYMTLAVYALRHGDAVVIAPTLQLSFLVTAPASYLFFREPITGRKLLGIGLGVCALVAFALG